MPVERIRFQGHNQTMLAARLDHPEGPHLSTAIFAHCFTCSKDITAARRIAARLSAMGIAVLRFDFTGLGHSDGEFANTSFSSNVEDLLAADRYLKNRGMGADLLIGHSLGGAAVLKAAATLPTVKAVVTLGAPANPEHVVENFATALPEIDKTGVANVHLGGRPFQIKKQFIDDLRATSMQDAIAHLKSALLVMHAPLDDVVDIHNATDIFVQAKHPKSFVTLDDADHLISDPADADYAAEVIAAWAARYLDLRPPAPAIGAPEGIVRVSEADPNGFLQDVQSGPFHHILADEPTAYGGTNKGMTPYGLLSASLGACTSMTVRMYARAKKIPLDHIHVDVRHDKMHAQDAEGVRYTTEKSPQAKVDHFHREICLEGDLDAAQKAKLLEIADKCPVHKTLHASAVITTVLKEMAEV
ncbi:MAG: alpha/beta fold hydrolase [Halocynthiibacter sp.]